MTDFPFSIEPDTGGRTASAAVPLEEKVNILIVDDRPDKLMALESTISELNQNIVIAHSGKEALRCLLRQDFAVILLDVNMPIMDGFETASLIRQRARSELTPIIFVSAINDAENHISRGYSIGAVDYILAPIVPEFLRAKVSVFVDLFRKTAQIERQADERANRIRAEAAAAEAEAARERSAFLAEAGSHLVSSLDPEETLQTLARLTVPRLADYCIVDMIEENGSLRQAAVAHREPGREAELRALCAHYPVTLASQHGAAKVLRTGIAELCTEVTPEVMAELFAGDECRSHLAALGPRAFIAVPLRARGRVLGALTLVSTTEERVYDSAALSLAEDLAQRAALALDNVRLYHTAQRARETAERASQAKDQFLAMLSHELRTPLTPVLNAVGLLELDEACSPDAQELLSTIRRNIELEARLIDDLLDLTRVSKGKVQLNLETADAHELLRQTLEICESDISQKQLQLEVKLKAPRHHLHGDPARLQQIFWNLIKNAVKFTPPHGRLTIATGAEPGDRLRVEVADTGSGIDAELLPRIFAAFEQGRRGHSGGLGLGLAITQALVSLHHGEISAASAGRDKGATFRVLFPTVEPPPPGDSAASHEAPDAHRVGLRLLLVEDHEDTSRTLSRLLTRRGYEVQTADTLERAITVAAEHPFDVLISDMGLPDGTGIQVMERLAARGPVRGIALSGFGMEEDIQRSKAVGFREHLTKPVDILRLDAAIQRVGRGGH